MDLQKCLDAVNGLEHLATASRVQYRDKFKKLCREFDKTPEFIFNHPKETLEFINSIKDCHGNPIGVNSRKALIVSVQIFFKHLPQITKRIR